MARALENLGSDSTYLEFFGLSRPPFERLARPNEIYNAEQNFLLMSHLTRATEQSDTLVAICGADGSGKTTLIKRYAASLTDDVSFATIDDTCTVATQFYAEFLRQLGFSDITGTLPELRHITKKFVIHRGMAGDSVLLMIDNAHLINPSVLEQLRWISATKVDDRRVLSVVLTGNTDLVRIMESPAMSQSQFQRQVMFHIRAYSVDEIEKYIWHRLDLAGGIDTVTFAKEAHPLIHRYSGGTPRLINMLCSAVLKEANTLEMRVITEELVRTVADRQRLLPHVVPLLGKGRRKTDPDFEPELLKEEAQQLPKVAPAKTKVKETMPAKPTENNKSAPKTSAAKAKKSQDAVEIPTVEIEQPSPDVKEMLAQIDLLTVELSELRGDRKRNLLDLNVRDVEIKDLRRKLEDQAAENSQLVNHLGDVTGENKGLNQAIVDNKKTLQKKEQEAKKTTSKMTAEIKEKAKELASLQSELELQTETVVDLKRLLKESKQECATLRPAAKTADELKIAADELKQSVASKDSQIDELKEELTTYDKDVHNLQEQLAEGTAKIEELMSATAWPDAEAPTVEKKANKKKATKKTKKTKASKTSKASKKGKKKKSTKKPVNGTASPQVEDAFTGTAFEVVKGNDVEQLVDVSDGVSRIMIGRSEDSEMRLDSKFVSRHHALIYISEQGAYIEDLNSFNGTIVNSKKIKRCDLASGDVIAIGDYSIRFRQN